MNTIRLFIVEDQPSILKSQIKLLGKFDQIQLVGTAMSGEDALEKIRQLSSPPHVVLCDLGLPKMSGIEVTKHIKNLHQTIEVLIFTVFEDEEKVLQAIKAGASGYLLKGALASKIFNAIEDVYHGGTVIQPSLAKHLLKHFSAPIENTLASDATKENPVPTQKMSRSKLTSRELECLQIISKGLSNNEAASVLKLSKATIRTHLEHIYQKLEVSNRVEAVTEGIRQGIIEI